MAAVGVEPVGITGPPGTGGRRRRLGRFEKTPYILIAPVLLVLAATLGYPLYRIIVLSFQHQSKRQLYTGAAPSWVGFQNYTQVLTDPTFWKIVERTFVVTLLMVVLSLGIALGLALLLNRVSRWIRTPMMALLMFMWAIPAIVSVQIFYWFADPNFGVFNYLLVKMGFGFSKHDWFADSKQGWGLIIAVVVWGAIPFLTVTLSAGMSMVPKELSEAAKMDGASPVQVFRAVTYPILKPLIVIITSLSVIWDFQVFNQVWAMRQTKPEPDYYVLGVYSYIQAFAKSDYGLGAAISILTVLTMLGMMVFYVRQMLRIGDSD
jgi:N,N'-diacetylchitobiose transport system permease protein